MHGATRSVAGRHTRFPTVRRRRWLSLAAAALVLLIGPGTVIVANKHATAESDDRHFILIATHGGPVWDAAGVLKAPDGTLICQKSVPEDECKERNTWQTGVKSGGRELWYFNVESDGVRTGTIDVSINAVYNFSVTGLKADRSHCFLISAFGKPRYTGNSLTGGCTPD